MIATGSPHDRAGRLQKNIPEAIELLIHLQAKINAHTEEMALVEEDLAPNTALLLISYGISARAARAACRRMRVAGRRVSFLQLLTLFPVPVSTVRPAAQGCSRVLVVEENLPGLLPFEALWAAVEARFGDDAEAMRAKLLPLLHAA